MKIRLAVLLCMSCLWAGIISTPPAVAQASVKSAKFCFNSWEPYAYKSKTGFQGISVDVVAEAARRAGYKAVMRELPWNRCIDLAARGELDGVLDAAKRENFLQGPSSYSAYTNHIWVRSDDPHTAMSAKALKERRIGLVAGYNYPAALMAMFRSANTKIEMARDDLTNLRKLAFGRTDAVVADETNGRYLAMNHSLDVRPLLPAHSADRLFVSFNRDRKAMHSAIDGEIGRMIVDGTVNRIYKRYVGSAASAPIR
jgi:polar amino acid transport system substrate-binding protein